ncbi:hypothetical protein BASA81_014030 [Batrachochytrium salamandrivorans]|nr:hypothetical protein BASA81_014030 [Batrachochytrium salamandrivorans]
MDHHSLHHHLLHLHHPPPPALPLLFGEFVTSFAPSYMRNHKAINVKNLRCFPSCSNEQHFDTGFCGNRVVASYFTLNTLALPRPEMLECYAEFQVASTEDRFRVSQVVHEHALGELIKGEVSEGPPATPASVVAGTGDINPRTGRITFSRDMKGWHYGWMAGRSHHQTLHEMCIYLLERNGTGGDDSLTVVLVMHSPAFQITSRKRIRKPSVIVGNTAAVVMAATGGGEGQSDEEDDVTPSFKPKPAKKQRATAMGLGLPLPVPPILPPSSSTASLSMFIKPPNSTTTISTNLAGGMFSQFASGSSGSPLPSTSTSTGLAAASSAHTLPPPTFFNSVPSWMPLLSTTSSTSSSSFDGTLDLDLFQQQQQHAVPQPPSLLPQPQQAAACAFDMFFSSPTQQQQQQPFPYAMPSWPANPPSTATATTGATGMHLYKQSQSQQPQQQSAADDVLDLMWQPLIMPTPYAQMLQQNALREILEDKKDGGSQQQQQQKSILDIKVLF